MAQHLHTGNDCGAATDLCGCSISSSSKLHLITPRCGNKPLQYLLVQHVNITDEARRQRGGVGGGGANYFSWASGRSVTKEEDGSIENEENVKINVVVLFGVSPLSPLEVIVLHQNKVASWGSWVAVQNLHGTLNAAARWWRSRCFSLWCSSITTFYCNNVYLCPMTIRYFGFLKIATLHVKTYLEVFVSLLHYCI